MSDRNRLSAATLAAHTTRRTGFSLVELMIVIVIIGILSGVAGFYLVGQTDQARQSRTLQQMQTLKGAIEIYYSTHTQYPAEGTSGLELLVQNRQVQSSAILDGWGTPMEFYIAPTDTGELWALYSAGPDKQFDTPDAIVMFESGRRIAGDQELAATQ